MRIALLCFQLNVAGGSQRQFFSLAEKLHERGHEVHVYTSELNQRIFPAFQKKLSIHVVGGPIENSATAETVLNLASRKIRRSRAFADRAKKMAEALQDAGHFDVVSGHDYETYKVAYFYKKKGMQTPFIWVMNEIPFPYMPKEKPVVELLRRLYYVWAIYFESKFFKSINTAIVLNEYDGRWLRQHFSVPYHIVPSGLNFDQFYNPVSPPDPSGPVRLLSFALLGRYRRFEVTLEAVHILNKRGLNVRGTIIGTGSNAPDDQYAIYLKKEAHKLGITDKIDFYFGSLPEEEISNIYQRGDIFVFPTYVGPPRRGYGWGLAVFEAIAAGKPTILCKTTGAAKFLEDDKTAVFVDPLQSEQVANSVERLMSGEKYLEIAQAGQDYVRKNISWERYAAQTEKIFYQQIHENE